MAAIESTRVLVYSASFALALSHTWRLRRQGAATLSVLIVTSDPLCGPIGLPKGADFVRLPLSQDLREGVLALAIRTTFRPDCIIDVDKVGSGSG